MKKALVIIMVMTFLLLSGCGITKKIEETTNGIGNITYNTFQGNVYGSSVHTAAMMSSQSDISIYVTTGIQETGFYVETKGCYKINKDNIAVPSSGCTYIPLSSIKNEADPAHYVDALSRFKGTLYKNDSGEVKIILMEQITNKP